MSFYATVYQKDYLWPVRKPYFPRTNLNCVVAAPIIDDSDLKKRVKTEPKCCSTRKIERATDEVIVGPSPEADRLEISPIDACLKKLLDENPNVLNAISKKSKILKSPLSKFNRDRLKTTYQTDYDHADDPNDIDLADLPAATKRTCPLDDSDPDNDLIDQSKQLLLRRAELTRRKRQAQKDPCTARTSCTLKISSRRTRREMEKSLPDYKKNAMPVWTSEYREAINKTGRQIAKQLSMSKRQREVMKLNKLLKPKLICNDAPS